MQIINGILFVVLMGVPVYCVVGKCTSRTGLFVRTHLYLFGILLLVNSVSFVMTLQKGSEQIYVEKEGYGGEEQRIPFSIKKEDRAGEISLDVQPRQLTEEETRERMKAAFAYFDQSLIGENEDFNHITKSLDIQFDYSAFPFNLEVRPADYALISEDGYVRNEREELLAAGYTDLLSGIPTTLTLELRYGEIHQEKTYSLTVFEKEKDEWEQLTAAVLDMLEKKEHEAVYEEGFFLPSVVEGAQLARTDRKKISAGDVLLFGVLLIVLLLFREKENMHRKEKKRKQNLLGCYSWFVNEMVLLLGAGMQVKNIFALLVTDYEKGEHKKDDARTPLIAELRVARQGFEIGMSEEQIYYQLGRRLKLPCYIKLMTLLEQNVKKGARGLTAIFEQEEVNVLEERKNLAKQYGEEAGTKLLGPMVVLLLIVMLMIMIPTFLGIM